MTAPWQVRLEATAFLKDQFPSPVLPEIAVAGRSNVGKSTLINKLLGVRLAHVAAAPGKTRSINFYAVTGSAAPFRLVDLPGYGYASRSKEERNKWSALIEAYVTSRKNLSLVLHLADFRHGLLENDLALQDWICHVGIPLLVVFTKGDKISRGNHRGFLEKYIRSGLKSVDVPVITSGETGSGIDELKGFISRWLTASGEQSGNGSAPGGTAHNLNATEEHHHVRRP